MNVWLRSMQFTLAMGLLLGSSTMQRSVAQSLDSSFFVAPPPPPGTGSPGQRSDAGSRPQSCRQAEKSLTAIAPVYPNNADLIWGATASGQPTLWFYVPYFSTSASGEFVLENAAKQQIVVKVPLAAKPGVMQVAIADLKTSLEVGKPYRWYFNVYCQNSNEVDGYVEGSITHQSLDASVRDRLMQTQNLPQKVEQLAAKGLWYDAVTIAAELRCSQSDSSYWTKLFQSVGLSEFAQEPIQACRKSG